jgi:hypothetical protein
MTLLDDAPARNEAHRNGAEMSSVPARPPLAAELHRPLPAAPAGDARTDTIDHAAAPGAADDASRDEIRDQASRFFWMWLLFATVVSIGGNVIHAWMTAPDTNLRILAAAAAAVPPAVLLGATHSVALLIKTRRSGYRSVDAGVLGAGMLLTVGVAACAFAMSFFSLRDLMILLGMNRDTARLWPIAVDLSLICSTLALLSLTSPRTRDLDEVSDSATLAAAALAARVANSGPSSPPERRLWWESIAAVVKEKLSHMRKVADLTPTHVAEILERLYDKGDSQRAICADFEKLHHREVRTIKQTADEVLARVTTAPPAPAVG